jgi:hypothetical protein
MGKFIDYLNEGNKTIKYIDYTGSGAFGTSGKHYELETETGLEFGLAIMTSGDFFAKFVPNKKADWRNRSTEDREEFNMMFKPSGPTMGGYHLNNPRSEDPREIIKWIKGNVVNHKEMIKDILKVSKDLDLDPLFINLLT